MSLNANAQKNQSYSDKFKMEDFILIDHKLRNVKKMLK